jgi:hypothetical protein
MSKPAESEIRIFEKKLRDGTVLTRTVTSAPESEVAARFDGYLPPAAKPAGGSSKPANSSN